eukprot:CAMPEP_0116090818 /NCGR_PEP_ID=MMETSP0327-20121206/7172_1 /TAXON_ID=44447 /ORGANISM="Pseudo-nitzschia delicatissima, Strain B596" /LENGTH=188 /DNA_ID=CAMNT_0003582123 /DNA_START=204 /DNA_END=771 /DNA_ORIENTATION=+
MCEKFGSFRAELSSKTPDTEAVEKSKNELVREVELFDLELTKLILWQNNLERQAKLNEQMEEEREQKIQATKQQVDKSSTLANKSLEQKNCMSEYQSLAKVINENHPTSSTVLQEQIDEIREVISDLEKKSAEKDEILKVREAQYQLLIQYMTDLKQSLKEDEGEEANDQGGNGEAQPMDIDNLYGDL